MILALRGNADAGLLADLGGGFAEHLDVEAALAEEQIAQRRDFFRLGDIGAVRRIGRAGGRRWPSPATTTLSLVQRMELSKLFDSTIRLAAASMSALASTRAGALPGPTPIAGIAGAVGRAHHRRAAGRQDHIDLSAIS